MRKIVPLAVAGAVVLVASGGTLGYATLDKEVTLSVDGQPTTFNTFSRTVGDVLEDKGISVGPNDVVAPGTDAKLTEGSEIAVKYGRQVSVTIDGDKRSFWTTARDVRGALQSAGIEAADAKLSTSRSTSIDREGLSWTIDTEKKIKINAGGESKTVQTTARTVKGALGAAKIKPDSDDKVSAKLNATIEDGDKITVVDVQVKKSSKKQSIDYDTNYRDSDKLYEDETEVKTEGKQGERTLSYKKTFHDGKLKNKKLVSDEVSTKAVDEVILQGTKERPEPEPEEDTTSEDSSSSDSSSSDSSSSDSSGSDSSGSDSSGSDSSDADSSDSDSSGSSDSGSDDAPAVASGSVWDQLAQCESGGDWSINTGNGFYGGLQFTQQTWQAFGGSGMPHEASREEQIRVAENVKAGQGWGAWPACSSQLGLY